jgi:hypothetical protein
LIVFGDSQSSMAMPGSGREPRGSRSTLLSRSVSSSAGSPSFRSSGSGREPLRPGPEMNRSRPGRRPPRDGAACSSARTHPRPGDKEPGPVVGRIEVQQPSVIGQPDPHLRGAPRVLGAILQTLEAATGGSAANRGFCIDPTPGRPLKAASWRSVGYEARWSGPGRTLGPVPAEAFLPLMREPAGGRFPCAGRSTPGSCLGWCR